jgi:hypothetical protein
VWGNSNGSTTPPGEAISVVRLMTLRGLAASLFVVLSMVAVPATTSFGQSGGPYDLRWNTIDGGGTTSATGGIYVLGGTVGQADAGRIAGGSVVVNGGFWKPLEAISPTATATSTMLPTFSAIPTVTATTVPSATATELPATLTPTFVVGTTPTATVATSPSATRSPVPTAMPTGTTPPTFSATSTSTPTPTPTPPPCPGDCDGNGSVTVDEILTLVNLALGNADVGPCNAGDANHDGHITIDEILTAVNNALNGCGV